MQLHHGRTGYIGCHGKELTGSTYDAWAFTLISQGLRAQLSRQTRFKNKGASG